MRRVPVVMAWVVNAFENSSEHSEYYLDLDTGDVKFFCPMDFPEHAGAMKRFDSQPQRYIRLPKKERDFAVKIRKDFVESLEETDLKELLAKSVESELKFRNALMEFLPERRRWYSFQSERSGEFLKNWFLERGIELVEKEPPPVPGGAPDIRGS